MNWKHVMIVFKKELKDIVRDRKTLFTSIILPIFLMPLLFLLIGGGTEKMSEEMTTDITVAL
ncbi:MAG TPA: ABC transporter permease, partial [Thermoclostridium caenicola]|nr:ABC transporter permease [Thermoclostridium caenicola]